MALIKNLSLHIYQKLCYFIYKHFGEEVETKFVYFARTRHFLNLKNPKDLNEKLQWLSLYWKNPLQIICADKYKVREYVTEKGCSDILNDLYAVYDNASELDFKTLPQSFVIKCNFGSGRNYICKDKSIVDENKVKALIDEWMTTEYDEGKEWQYIDIPKKIIAERYLLEDHLPMMEYQLFCFNGNPGFFLVRNDLGENEGAKDAFAVSYSVNWERQYYRKGEEKFKIELPRPINFDKMLAYSKILSQDFPHVRVDFYEVGNKLVFGELTFSSSGGILSAYKKEVIEHFGKLLVLPKKYEKEH